MTTPESSICITGPLGYYSSLPFFVSFPIIIIISTHEFDHSWKVVTSTIGKKNTRRKSPVRRFTGWKASTGLPGPMMEIQLSVWNNPCDDGSLPVDGRPRGQLGNLSPHFLFIFDILLWQKEKYKTFVLTLRRSSLCYRLSPLAPQMTTQFWNGKEKRYLKKKKRKDDSLFSPGEMTRNKRKEKEEEKTNPPVRL